MQITWVIRKKTKTNFTIARDGIMWDIHVAARERFSQTEKIGGRYATCGMDGKRLSKKDGSFFIRKRKDREIQVMGVIKSLTIVSSTVNMVSRIKKLRRDVGTEQLQKIKMSLLITVRSS